MAKGELSPASRTLIDVPYRGQQFKPRNWREDGFDSPEHAEYWSRRSCGIACVGMLIDFYSEAGPSLSRLLEQGLALKGYSSRGWVHATLARILSGHGVPAEAVPMRSCGELVESVKCGAPIIASVGDEFPIDGTKGGHLVVVTGYAELGNTLTAVYFNDPSAWGRTRHAVPVTRFFASFSGRVVRPI